MVTTQVERPKREAPAAPARIRRPPSWVRPVVFAVGCTFGLRVLTELVALNSAYGTTFPHRVARDPGLLLRVWNRWDAGSYLTIAQHWYPGAGHASTLPKYIAFAPLYPAVIWCAHAVTTLDDLAAGQLVSALACVAAIVGVVRLGRMEGRGGLGGTAALMVVAFPTAYFLLADYPDSLGLALVAWAFVAARRHRWLLAGLASAMAFLTVYYLVILVVPLLVEVWQWQRRLGWPEGDALRAAARNGDTAEAAGAVPAGPGHRHRRRPAWTEGAAGRLGLPAVAVAVPPVAAFVAWMGFCASTYGQALAFARVQGEWTRTLAAPWTLVAKTWHIVVRLRFLDTRTASVMWLFDAVAVVLLAAVAVYAFVRIRRSYGILLLLAVCVYSCETALLGETREVLALAPFFVGLGRFVHGHPWRERAVLACFLPAAYYLLWRWGTGRFAD